MSRKINAPGKNRQIANSKTYRSRTTLWADMCDFLFKRSPCLVITDTLFAALVIFPQTMDVFFPVILFMFAGFEIRHRHPRLPIRMPQWTSIIDHGDPMPERRSFNKASGVMFLGNDMEEKELWLKQADMTTHMLVYGTTGSGKTVTLQSLAYNAFVMGRDDHGRISQRRT